MEEIKVMVSTTEQTSKSVKSSLYLIFDNGQEEASGDGTMKLMDEVIEFSNKTKLPCHIKGHTICNQSGSTKTAFIPSNTNENTRKKLKEKGFNKIINREEETGDNTRYFKRKEESAIGCNDILPVILSLKHGVKPEEANADSTDNIPIVCITKNNDVSVLWHKEVYIGDTKKPWKLKTLSKQPDEVPEEISNLSEVLVDIDIDTLICNLIVSVCLKKVSSKEEQYGKYYTASSLYLLSKGDLTFYKKYMKVLFNERYQEYMDQEDLSNQNSLSNLEDTLHKVQTTYGADTEGCESRTEEHLETDKTLTTSLIIESAEQIKWNFQSNGLLFFALLYNNCQDEALTFVEEGFVGIHHILVGCVILQDEINSGKTATIMTQSLQRKQKAFTDRAIKITSYIYEADKERKLGQSTSGYLKCKCTDQPKDENFNYAGRLLLNHGYLRVAINTENNAYLESDTVRKILRKTFYGTESVHRQTTFTFLVLAAVHFIMLPLLMINMDASPFRWFYQKYKLHYMKVYLQMFGFFILLLAYANMLLFDYRADGITNTDYFIILWMASFFVDETNQVIVAVIRGKWRSYSIDWWNLLDWLMIALYTTGMLLKTGEGKGFQITSKLLLVVAFTGLCTRLLHLSCMTEFLGRKLVINRKMIKDTSAFMIIISIIMSWYSVSYYALLYENSEFTWIQLEKILRNGYWMLFGELNLDATDLECTTNRTLYESNMLRRCPSDLGVYVTPYLKAFYGLLAVVLLLNLLIAMYSDTYTKVQQNANLSWLQMQIDLFEEYSIKTVFPIHLQLLALLGIIPAVVWIFVCHLRSKFCDANIKKETRNPMFVKVFLYDSSYDVKNDTTYLAEATGVNAAKGPIDLSDSDAVTTLKILKDLESKLDKIIQTFCEDKEKEQTSF